MKILIADKLPAAANKVLEDAGHTVVTRNGIKGDELVEAVRAEGAQVLVVRSTKVPAAVIEAGERLELIVRAGAGYDNIDVASASRRGVFVANCPGKNAAAVAELTIGLLIALDRYIAEGVADSRQGVWNKAKYSKGRGLRGRTLGIVGMGSIGRAVAVRARALDLRVVAWSRSLTDQEAAELGIERAADPAAVAREADIVTLHVAGAPETKGLADRAFFEAMKPGALFINTARSSVVDEAALREALEQKGIRAALDVMEGEPAAKDGAFAHPLAGHPSVYMTHHIGASTEQAQEAVALDAARIINAYADTGTAPNVVNMAKATPATHLLTVRHLDRVGVLAAVLDEVRKANWNVQEMENLIFAGAEAACARIRFDGAPDEAVTARIAACPDVLAASVLPL